VNYNIFQTFQSAPQAGSNEVEIDLLLNVPVSQQIRYKPSFLENTSEFWIQYLALLIPAFYVNYYLILGAGFKRKIIPSFVWSEIKQAQRDTTNKSALA